MNHLLKADFYNKRNLNRNINYQLEIQKNNFRQIKEYYKSKTNLYNFLKNKNCSQFLENFELIDYINSGASGVVYKGCSNKDPNNTVCLKFLLNKLELESRDTRFNNNYAKEAKSGGKKENNINRNVLPKIEEIKIQQKLQHKNIAKYYDYCDLKEYGCIVMELADYGDLDFFKKKFIQRNNFPETFLCYITKQILDGLFYIHKLKIIHMDIKPQNLLIDKNLNIKITDFSASFSYEKYKKNNKILLPFSGTSLYMSPEVLSCEYIDYIYCNKIDLYSLGVVLYYFAFEQFPYGLIIEDCIEFNLIIQKIKNNKLIFPNIKIYSSMFLNFLSKLLEKDIRKRINIYQALNEPWVKSGEILFNEKEKIDNTEIFLINIITDNFRCFNEYINSF
jgi:serine/threonine protein kinase